MRFAMLGVSHETNTFSSRPTTYAHFERSGILRGDEIRRRYRESQATLAGFFDAGDRLGVEVVPLVFAITEPMGTITADAFDRIVGEMLERLRTGGPWDGVLLGQHGAAVSERASRHGRGGRGAGAGGGRARRADGAGARHARQRVAAHGRARDRDRDLPHQSSPGRAAARRASARELVVRAARGEIRPVQALETPPLVINIVRQCTDEEPMRSLVAGIDEVLARPRLLSASVAEGYPYADVAEMGMSFLAVSGRRSRGRPRRRAVAGATAPGTGARTWRAPSPRRRRRSGARRRRRAARSC